MSTALSLIRPHCRSGRDGVAEQALLPHGVLHGGQEQHEGDPLVLGAHLPAVPLLRSPPPAGAGLHRHPGRAAPPSGPSTGAAQQTGLGAQPQQRHRRGEPGQGRAQPAADPASPGRAVVLRERFGGLRVRPGSLSEEKMPLDMTCTDTTSP